MLVPGRSHEKFHSGNRQVFRSNKALELDPLATVQEMVDLLCTSGKINAWACALQHRELLPRSRDQDIVVVVENVTSFLHRCHPQLESPCDLNENGPQRLTGSGITGGMALLEGVSHWQVDFEFSEA